MASSNGSSSNVSAAAVSKGQRPSHDDHHHDQRRQLVAQARWGLLRAALQKVPPSKADENVGSIHNFAGFSLLERTEFTMTTTTGLVLDSDGQAVEKLQQRLRNCYCDCRIQHGESCSQAAAAPAEDETNDNDDDLEARLWALHCLQPRNGDGTTTTSSSTTTIKLCHDPRRDRGGLSKRSRPLRERLAAKGILLCPPNTAQSCGDTNGVHVDNNNNDSNETHHHLCSSLVKASLPPNSNHVCVAYRLPVPSSCLTPCNNNNNNGNVMIDNSCTADAADSAHVVVYVRERTASSVKLSALVSQQHYGVDNTGNTRVWDSEKTLAYLLLEEHSVLLSKLNMNSLWHLANNTAREAEEERQSGLHKNKQCCLRVLELGAGMAGLAGLALAATTAKGRSTRVVLSDGHPDAVLNNRINIALNRAAQVGGGGFDKVSARRLLWTTNGNADNDNDSLQQQRPFDLILASDCTHFEEFHAALALTIARNLRVGGVAIMLQPPRGPSLANFVSCVPSTRRAVTGSSCDHSNNDNGNNGNDNTPENGILPPLLQVVYWSKDDDETPSYSPTISKLHQGFRKSDATYDANIHCPQLLVLKKCRPLTDEDRTAMLRHMEERSRTSTTK